MNPAWSLIFFTTLAGAAQGLVVALAVAALAGLRVSPGFLSASLLLALGMLLAGLVSSFAHLGRPARAWRSVLMWRTSWLSREVIALPVFIAATGLWWLLLRAGVETVWMPLLVIPLAFVLWLCTARIYSCIRFIEEWAQPLTLVNFILIGLSSGLVLTSALAALAGEQDLLRASGPAALLLTLAAWLSRAMSLRHNATLRHRSTLQSAIGVDAAPLTQRAMGMTGGSFNTREFFHHCPIIVVKQVKVLFLVAAFALPSLLALWAVLGGGSTAWLLAALLQAPGLLAERWFFFAQVRHPQNLYYQVVS
ncbi:dimethyl sulfoxide reductase anchor subunit family protein [Piscinibacter sakaiensis]|uniref:dimethyl sulfoxide reductase anchor subunit family protein n=1 Tax=Piscinibacter sakaiensis TaxID=1547922 RepID=UPI003AAF9358